VQSLGFNCGSPIQMPSSGEPILPISGTIAALRAKELAATDTLAEGSRSPEGVSAAYKREGRRVLNIAASPLAGADADAQRRAGVARAALSRPRLGPPDLHPRRSWRAAIQEAHAHRSRIGGLRSGAEIADEPAVILKKIRAVGVVAEHIRVTRHDELTASDSLGADDRLRVFRAANQRLRRSGDRHA